MQVTHNACSYFMKMTEHHLFPTFKCIVAFGVLCMGSNSTTKGNTIGWMIKVHVALIQHHSEGERVRQRGEKWERNQQKEVVPLRPLSTLLLKVCCVTMSAVESAVNTSLLVWISVCKPLRSLRFSAQPYARRRRLITHWVRDETAFRLRAGPTAVVPRIVQMLQRLP